MADEECAYLKESMRKLDETQSSGEPPELYPKHPQMPGSVTGEINVLRTEVKRLKRQAQELRDKMDSIADDVHFLKMGIAAGDPVNELLQRCVDIRRKALTEKGAEDAPA